MIVTIIAFNWHFMICFAKQSISPTFSWLSLIIHHRQSPESKTIIANWKDMCAEMAMACHTTEKCYFLVCSGRVSLTVAHIQICVGSQVFFTRPNTEKHLKKSSWCHFSFNWWHHCHYDNLQCDQWWQSSHHDKFQFFRNFSVFLAT